MRQPDFIDRPAIWENAVPITLNSTKELTNDHIAKLHNDAISLIIGMTDDEVDRLINTNAWARSIKKYNNIFKYNTVIVIDEELDMRFSTPNHSDSIYLRFDVPVVRDSFIRCTHILDFPDCIKKGHINAAVGSAEWRFTKDQHERVIKYIRTLHDIIML